MEYAQQARTQSGALGGTLGKPSLPYPTEAALSLFGDVNAQVTGAMGRVINAATEVRKLADALFGSQPETNQAQGGAERVTSSHFSRADETRNNLAGLHDALNGLEYQLSRLSTLA